MALYRLKEGKGPHRKKIDGIRKKLVPGDEIELSPQEIVGFKDKFELIGPPPVAPEDEEPSIGLTLQHQGGGKYNVFNEATKEFINDGLLTKKEAESLISDVAKAEEGIEPEKGSVLGKLLSTLRDKEGEVVKEEEPKIGNEVIDDGKESEDKQEPEKGEPSKVESSEDLAGKDSVPHRRRAVSKKGKSGSGKK